jgi:amino acid adenylation domain-containing protein
MSKTATISPRPQLNEAQQALLKKRLQQARAVTAAPSDVTGIPRRETRENLPLSSAQLRLWFIDQLEPGSPVYNMCEGVRMRGVLSVPALERALNAIIRRHEILRTNFIAVDGNPVQVIAEERPLSLVVHDLSALPAEGREARLGELIHDEARLPFDLRTDPLMRVLLTRLEPEEHVFMFTMHHIISDGWSLGVFFDELASFYEAAVAGGEGCLPDLPLQYGDFVLWEKERLQGGVLTRQLAYWKRQLQGRLPVLELPADHPRAVSSVSRGATKALPLPSVLSRKLKALSQQEGVTLFMTLLAAFQTLLHRYTGEEDIVVGSVVAGRPQVSLEKLIGFFVNTLVLRESLAGDPTFRELLARTQETTLEALAHQELPFARLVEELHPDRNLSGNPLFHVMFVLQNTPAKPARLPGLSLQPLEVESGAAKFDLLLIMTETPDGLNASVEYNADLFEGGTIARMLGHLHVLLEGIVENPDRRISTLPLLTPGERRQLLVDWNRTETGYPRDRTIGQLFDEQAALTPKAVAVVCGTKRLTYRELDEWAGLIASRLRRHGVGPDVLVGVFLERSLELIVSLLAIIKAGGAYVSFDPASPVERLGFMLKETQAPVLLTMTKLDRSVTALMEASLAAGSLVNPAVIRLDASSSNEPDGTVKDPLPLTPDNLAYVSYTSGSTGTPKGVCVSHRGVVRLVRETNFARFESSDVFLQLASVSFDASTLEIWAPLLNGGRLVVFPPGQFSLSGLGECIEKNGVTVLWLTAGLFHQVVEEHLGYLKNVRLLLAGGDVLSVPMVARTLRELPLTQLINGYGPTENTTFTCCHLVPGSLAEAETRSVPIGRPIANTQVYVLDKNHQPVPVGVPGELYTGGDGLARGYLHRPELTAEKFVTQSFDGTTDVRLYKTGDRVRWLADGNIEFMGRMDRQVKIRGFRVEPAETEAALLTHPAVKNCAVIVGKDPSGEKRLVACVVAKPEEKSGPAEWGDYLRLRLPDYMVPSAFVALDDLPLSPNGKVDCAALLLSAGETAEPAESRTEPRDELERTLAGLWEEVLGVKSIGIHDRFFEMGGHSLLAVRLLAKIEKTFKRKLPVSAVFQHPTVAELGELLRSDSPAEIRRATSLVEIQPMGSRPPIYLVHGVGGGMFWGYANLSRHLGPDQPVHAFKSRGLDGLPEWTTIGEMARSYVADLKAFQPRGPYVLGGYCFGGNVAYEMARQLREQGDEVAMLVLISSSPPNSEYETTQFRWSPAWMFKFCRNVGLWLTSFALRWDARERRDFVRWKWRLLRKKLIGVLGKRPAAAHSSEVESIVDLAVVGDDQRRLWDTHMRALIRHHPQPYDGKLVLFRSAEHLFLCSFDEHCGWSELVRDVSVKIVPGDHGRVLEEPFVSAVADELRRCLDETVGRARKEVLA